MNQTIGPQEVLADIPCCECGYNLRGLNTEGRCPECGIAVRFSLSAPPRLAMAYVPWVRSVRRGAMTLFCGYALFTAEIVGLPCVRSRVMATTIVLTFTAAGMALTVIGGHLFGRAEPYCKVDAAPFCREAVPFTAWAAVVTLPVAFGNWFPIPTVLAIATNQIVVVLYAAVLARRIPAPALASLNGMSVAAIAGCWVGVCVAGMLHAWWATWPLMLLSTVIPTVWMGVLSWTILRRTRTRAWPT